jgi:hypothetical protein
MDKATRIEWPFCFVMWIAGTVAESVHLIEAETAVADRSVLLGDAAIYSECLERPVSVQVDMSQFQSIL